MKLRLAILLVIISYSSNAQIHLNWKGRVFKNASELPELNKCVWEDVRGDSNRTVCFDYMDTVNNFHVIFTAQELSKDTGFVYDIIDAIQYKLTYDYLDIGSYEGHDSAKRYSFVIGIESRKSAHRAKSGKIKKAWAYSAVTRQIEELPIQNLYRIHEGYYTK